MSLKMWLLFLTLAWSLSMPWWRYSLMPLVYALHLLLGMLVLWALSLEKQRRNGPWLFSSWEWPPSSGPPSFSPCLSWDYSFFGNGESQKAENNRQKVFLFALLSFALGRSTALYLPLRSALHPEIAYGDLTHLADFIRHVLAMRFSHFVGVVTVSTVGSVLRQMLAHLWGDLTPMGTALLTWGIGLAVRSRKKIPVFLWVGMGWGLLEVLFVFTIPFPTFESHQVLLGWVYSGLVGNPSLGFSRKMVEERKVQIPGGGWDSRPICLGPIRFNRPFVGPEEGKGSAGLREEHIGDYGTQLGLLPDGGK